MTRAGPIRADALKSYVERVERLEEERGAIGSDIRDVYSEAKGTGYDVKTMKKIVRERKMDAADRDEQEALLDTYRHALGMPGATYRSVAEDLGISKSKLHRLVPNESRGTDGTAEEVIGSGEGIGHNSKRACILPRSAAWQEITAARDAADAAQAAEVARIAAEKEAERERRAAEREAERLENIRIDADPLEIPAHLDRRTKDRRQTAAPQ